ncbi:hypothetical protein B9Z55_018149 [Caenorhabditis nigoni]|uniref:7TM GPCR serpentine receptor class x (Srx) domain-containing protein n=2 Tax=Caenorhabditis nigoni TaxID=1611254 RepID=A0A2G5TDF1_9PELO|nr:hypothetical protein B9Z55_018149 [Caenorhabditis nigoni]
MVALTLFINLLTAYKAGRDSRVLLSAAGVQMSKEQRQREKSFIKQSFFQGAAIFAGQVTYYVTAPFLTDYSVMLFLDASLWAFMHAFEGVHRFGVRTDVLIVSIALNYVQSICIASIKIFQYIVL